MSRFEAPPVNRPALLVLALCSLVALSGCAAVDEVARPHTPTADELPPGVDESGVTNTTKLLEANAAALDDAGYASRLTANGSIERSESETVRANVSVVRRVQADDNRSFFRYRVHSVNQTRSTAAWRNETTVVARMARNNETYYRSASISRGFLTQGQWELSSNPLSLRAIVAHTNWTVTDVNRPLTGGSARIVLHPSETQDPNTVLSLHHVENATLVVDSDGVIHELSYTASYGPNGKGRIRVQYRLTELGVDQVDRPAWTAEALGNETATATA